MQSAPPCTETGCSTETADLYRGPKTRNHEGGFFATWYLRSSTKVLLAVVARRKRTSCGGMRWRGAIMRVVTEILSGRRDQFSSVERLIAALAWERLRTNTSCCVVTLSGQAGEMLLLNVSSSWCRRTERTDNDSSNASLLAIFCVNPVAPTQRSCNSVGCPPYEKPSYPA